MDIPTTRWGIIGPGRIAHTFAKAAAVVDGAVLHAVASRDADRSRQFAGQYQIPRVYDSYEALAADPEVDAVYIATPHRYHREQALLCLEAGKAVLCEKPLTVNAAETRALIDLAHKKQVFLMEALWSRYLPIYSHVRDWLDSGLIGDVELIQSTLGFAMTRDPNDRLLKHELAGGALLDLGVYNIAMSQWVQGDPGHGGQGADRGRAVPRHRIRVPDRGGDALHPGRPAGKPGHDPRAEPGHHDGHGPHPRRHRPALYVRVVSS